MVSVIPNNPDAVLDRLVQTTAHRLALDGEDPCANHRKKHRQKRQKLGQQPTARLKP